MTRNQVLQIKKLKTEGKTNAEIGAIMNCHPGTISRWVMKLRNAGHTVPRVEPGREKIDLTNLE